MTTTQEIRKARAKAAQLRVRAQIGTVSKMTDSQIVLLIRYEALQLSDEEKAMLDPEMRALLNAKPMGNAGTAKKS